MNDLDKALGDIHNIRKQMANATQFRGYGPVTLALTGVFAVMAAAVQAIWVTDPLNRIDQYLCIWIAAAVVSVAVTSRQMYTRARRIHSGLSDEMIRMAVEQFLPSAGTGVLLTVVLLRCAPQNVWMLPGLWQVLYSLGVFSSCRFLPKTMVATGVWYLLTGLNAIVLGGANALSPWVMGIPFALGQLGAAAILLRSVAQEANET